MPVVRIDVLAPWSEADIGHLGDAVHAALVETMGVPARDRFQVIEQHAPGEFVFDRAYLDVPRSDRFVLIQVTLSAGRSTEVKQSFYRRLAELVHERVGLSIDDVAICLIENQREDWSFGRGDASYVVHRRSSGGSDARRMRVARRPSLKKRAALSYDECAISRPSPAGAARPSRAREALGKGPAPRVRSRPPSRARSAASSCSPVDSATSSAAGASSWPGSRYSPRPRSRAGSASARRP
ncbi:MAG: tautomerase family protein [Chloroflexi bacterium]|nr:tautomerase family protein [Chloroflexota bacterium]